MAQQSPLSKSLTACRTARQSADAGQRIQRASRHHSQYVWDRSELSPWLRAELARLGSTRSAWIAADDGDISRASKGTHGTQEFLPNTYPLGAVNPCPACPAGYAVRDVERQFARAKPGPSSCAAACIAGLRRVSMYTFAKAIDDDAVLGGLGAAASTNPAAIQREEPVGRAELAGPERGTRSFDFRSTAPGERDHSVHHRHGNGRRNAAERLEGHAVQRMDVHYHHRRRKRTAAHTDVSGAGAGHGRHRRSSAGLHGRVGLRRSAGFVAESGALMPRRSRVNGAMRGAIPSPGPRSSL